MGDMTKGFALLEQALAIRERKLVLLHPELATSYNDLGEYYLATGEWAKAESYLKQALAIRQQKLGDDHPLTAVTHQNLQKLSVALD